MHCCFNIYKRPTNGLNDKPNNKYEWIKIHRQDSKNYDTLEDYDIRMCYWGNGSAGKILAEGESYSGEYKIKIKEIDIKDEVIDFIKSFDWNGYINGIAMKRIKQYHIIDVLQEHFPELT